MAKTLTVGCAVFGDPCGAYFTLSGLRANHGGPDAFEILVVDNAPLSCERTRGVCEANGGKYHHKPNLHGTSAPRDEVFRLAETPWVMCCDSHVLFETRAIEALIRYAEDHPDSKDMIQGPLIYDNGERSDYWRAEYPPALWGVWDKDPRGEPDGITRGSCVVSLASGVVGGGMKVGYQPAFEIPMQGLGVWAMRKAAWPGFNPLFSGFGGEEGYIHEVVRRRGGKALCLPALRWRHRFRDARYGPPPYPLTLEDHVFNLLVGHREVGIDAVESIRRYIGGNLPSGVFDDLHRKAQVQPWDAPGVRPESLKMLGVWYSNNSAPAPLLKHSLDSIARAKTLSRTPVEVSTCVWESIPGNPFPEILAAYKAGPGHLNIVRQIRQAIGDRKPDVVCMLEHDVLYPPDYFDRVAMAFRRNPHANVISNLDYEGLNATGWLAVRERQDCMHQMAFRYPALAANLDRAEADCIAQGWCEIEPKEGRETWARIPPRGVMPSVHVNHDGGRISSHGEVVFNQHSGGKTNHPFWGQHSAYWPGAAGRDPACVPCAAPPVMLAGDGPPDLETWYQTILTVGTAARGDFYEHMDTVRELAAKCDHVSEVSGWHKPTLVSLLAGCPGRVVSYCGGTKPDWVHAAKLLGDRFAGVQADQPVSIEPTDLLIIDTLHRAPRVFQELERYAPSVRKYIAVHCTTDPYGETGDDGGPGVLPGVRGYLMQHKEWVVKRHDKNNHGLMVLSRLDEDHKTPPGIMRKALNFARSTFKHKMAGEPMVDDKTWELRMDACLECEWRTHDTCAKCGCPTESKCSYATEQCPLDPPKWEAIPPAP